MTRLTRAERQDHNRAKVLEAARAVFAELGFRDAKIDTIAERAELTRGAVYSNFPGKRALYFAVLAQAAERAPLPPRLEPGLRPDEALAAFARAWVMRLPLATEDRHGPARLGMDLMPEILADERTRRPFAQLMRLDAVLLGLALERLSPPAAPDGRMVRLAETVLTTLHGAAQMAAAAPGFLEPFHMITTCARLAGLDLDDRWSTPPIVAPSRTDDMPWTPPTAFDLVHGAPADLSGDGVVTVLGLHRASAAEDAARAVTPGESVTAVLVSSAPDELAALVRLNLTELRTCLRQAVPAGALPRLQVVCDATGTVAAAAGVPIVDDATETAVRITSGRIVARADGFGAGHAAARA